MTMRGLSAASGVSRSQISRFENGERQPTADELVRLVEATGARLVLLVDGVAFHVLPELRLELVPTSGHPTHHGDRP